VGNPIRGKKEGGARRLVDRKGGEKPFLSHIRGGARLSVLGKNANRGDAKRRKGAGLLPATSKQRKKETR